LHKYKPRLRAHPLRRSYRKDGKVKNETLPISVLAFYRD